MGKFYDRLGAASKSAVDEVFEHPNPRHLGAVSDRLGLHDLSELLGFAERILEKYGDYYEDQLPNENADQFFEAPEP